LHCFDKAIEIEPLYATAWKNKAIGLQSLGRDSEAKAAFNRAKELGLE